MTIKAMRKSSTTAICPDCGKQHRIHRVSQGEYIKGCIYPCCVYWLEDGGSSTRTGVDVIKLGEGKHD